MQTTSIDTPSLVIGTPYQSQAKRVLLLGSGELGKEVAIALQRFGVEIHAADRYAHAPAMQVAHFSHVFDMTDADALQKCIKQVSPHIIIPEIEAIATEALLEIEQQGIQVVPTAFATNVTMNRERIRKLAAESLTLPTSIYRFAGDLNSFRSACDDVGYPCFVKPVMSSSGKGQSRVLNRDEVDAAWEHALSAGRVKQPRVIIESQIYFETEITLLTVRARNANTGQIETYFCDPIGHLQVNGDYVESWQPQLISSKALIESQRIAEKITTALGGLGVFGVELFVKGDYVWFSEVSPRPHDTGLVTLASQYQSEFELHARAILGMPVFTERHSAGASAVIYAGVEGQNLTYHGIQNALTAPETDIRIFAKPNATPFRRLGVVTARGEDVESARSIATVAAKQITTQTK